MITTIAPLLLDNFAAGAGAHVTTTASTFWDIGANIKTQGIRTAVYMLMGGTALVAAFEYLIARNRTGALKTVAIGLVVIGLVSNMPALGGMAKDTTTSITRGGAR